MGLRSWAFLRILLTALLLVGAGVAAAGPGGGTEAAGTPAAEQAPQAGSEVDSLRRELAEARARSEQLEEELSRSRPNEPARSSLSLPTGLFERKTLPPDPEGWAALISELTRLPEILAGRLGKTVLRVSEALGGAGTGSLLLLILAAAVAVLAWTRLRRLTEQGVRSLSVAVPPFARRAITVALDTIGENLGAALIVAVLAIAGTVLELPVPDRWILVAPALLVLAVRVGTSLAGQLLVAERLPVENRHPKTYRRIRLALIVGSGIVALWALSRVSPLSAPVRIVLDRVALLFLLVVTPAALSVGFVVRERLRMHRTAWWFLLVRVGTRAVPLVILVAAGLGLVGFVELARSIAWHLTLFLLVLAGCFLFTGVVSDGARGLRRVLSQGGPDRSRWVQSVVDPVQRAGNVVVFLAGAWLLTVLYDWDRDSVAGQLFAHAFETPLFGFGGTAIDFGDVLLAILAVVLVIWFARWIREISYRSVYRRVADAGLRNTLATFTQYVVVILGFVVVLQSMGIDLTALTVFAGAVGIGIGFGMQTIASNFVSGLILLIERPLRDGDVVTIGDRDGIVTRIGIRSLTIRRFSREEVIIPNSDVIENAFMNWSHADNLVRLAVYFHVSYADDPKDVIRVVEEALGEVPSILKDPPPMVFLWEFGKWSLTYRMNFFVDIIHGNLFIGQSDALLAVWGALKKAGMTVPFPQGDFYLKQGGSLEEYLRGSRTPEGD